MKTNILLLVIALLFVGVTKAQTKAPFNYYAKETLDAIGATPEQQQKIAEIKNNTNVKIRAVKANTALTEEQKKAEYKTIYGEGAALYNGVLSEVQHKKLREYIIKYREDNK